MKKLKAIVCLCVDKKAVMLIDDIAGQEFVKKNFSFSYDVLVERQYVHLVIQHLGQDVLNIKYFYTLLGNEDGEIQAVLFDDKDNEVMRLDFDVNYNFESIIEYYN